MRSDILVKECTCSARGEKLCQRLLYGLEGLDLIGRQAQGFAAQAGGYVSAEIVDEYGFE